MYLLVFLRVSGIPAKGGHVHINNRRRVQRRGVDRCVFPKSAYTCSCLVRRGVLKLESSAFCCHAEAPWRQVLTDTRTGDFEGEIKEEMKLRT